MALTLTEGNKYSTTELDRVVIDLLVKDSRVLELLPFEALLGNSLTYDMITTDSTAAYYAVGDTWTEDTPAMTQDTVVLKRLGGDADIDEFILETRANKIDIKNTIIQNKIKAVQYKFVDTFYYGDEIVGGFSGLHDLLTSTTYNTVQMATDANGAALTIMKLREAIDLVRFTPKPKHMFMSRLIRRRLSKYLDSVGQHFQRGVDEFGRHVSMFDDIEIVPDDHLLDTESTTSAGAYSDKSSDDQATVFILAFAPQAVCGVQGRTGVKTVPLGELETKDASRYRIKWSCGLKFEHLRSSVKVCGILSGSDVTA